MTGPANGFLEIASAAGFGPGLSVTWFAETVFKVSGRIARTLAPKDRDAALKGVLEKYIYENFYLTGGAVPVRRAPNTTDAASDVPAFRQAIFAANKLGLQRQDDWRVRSWDGERHVIERDGLRRQAKPDMLKARGVQAPDPGQFFSADTPSAFAKLSPGFVFFQSAGGALGPRLIRFYWHVVPRGAARLVSEVTSRLGALDVPFSFKILSSPAGYERGDAAVLYLSEDFLPRILPDLVDIQRRMKGLLHDPVPALTLRLAPGLSVAEDPGDGASFGQACAKLIASSILANRHERCAGTKAEAVAAALRDAGVDPDRPHLRAGSSGCVYGLLLVCKHFVRSHQGTTAYVYPYMVSSPFARH